MTRLSALIDEQRRYAREARRQRFTLDNPGRALHYALKALAVYAEIQWEIAMRALGR